MIRRLHPGRSTGTATRLWYGCCHCASTQILRGNICRRTSDSILGLARVFQLVSENMCVMGCACCRDTKVIILTGVITFSMICSGGCGSSPKRQESLRTLIPVGMSAEQASEVMKKE